MRRYIEIAYHGAADLESLNAMPFEVVKCLECGFIWTKYILNDNFITKLYSSWILQDKKIEWHNSEGLDKYLVQLRILLACNNYLNKNPHEIKLLDVGFGWGHLLFLAKGLGNNVWGNELPGTPEIEVGKSNGIKCIDLNDLNGNLHFDIICCEQVLEHVPDPKGLLNTLVDLLCEDGLIHIGVPSCSFPFSVERNLCKASSITSLHDHDIKEFQRLLMLAGNLGHINGFNRKCLMTLAAKCGLNNQPMFINEMKATVLSLDFKYLLRPLYNHVFGTEMYFRKI